MNAAYNHGSQGDFFASRQQSLSSDKLDKAVSLAPPEVGQSLRKAALEGDGVTLKLLLDNWKNDPVINQGDTIGTTALHTAASHGHKDCVVLLLEYGADKNIKNHYGQTAYQHAQADNAEIKELVKPSNPPQDGSCIIL